MAKIQKCPMCNSGMSRLYMRIKDEDSKKRSFVGIGWICNNPSCEHIIRD